MVYLKASRMSLKISRILHAGYVFECDGTQIAFDPIFENPFSRNCYAFPDVRFDHEQIKKLQLSAVFISHFHDDHCSMESLNYLDRKTPIYVYCIFEELFSLIKRLGFKNVHSLAIDFPVTIGSIEVTPRRALDADVDSLFQIKAAGLNVLNVVDSWIDYETLAALSQSGPWDMVLWPFQTMREIEVISPSRATPASGELPEEWIEQLKILNPRIVVPSSCQLTLESWSWYNQAFFPISYQQFKTQVNVALPNAQVIRLNPSVTVILAKNSIEMSSPLSWVQPVGEQNLDYEYNPENTPPSTAEIARHFAPLTAEQTQRVYEYCQSGLLDKYRSLDSPMDPYFSQPRYWCLSVFDHDGSDRRFYYIVNGGCIQHIADNGEPLAWTTEVPIAKLYAALELGESLTSMYMRINDVIFSPEIEREIQNVDIVEDPLIRSLFSGVFGSYQLAQLKRITEADAG